MPPRVLSQEPTSSRAKKAKPATQKRTTLKLEASTANTKRINPLTAVRSSNLTFNVYLISVTVSLLTYHKGAR